MLFHAIMHVITCTNSVSMHLDLTSQQKLNGSKEKYAHIIIIVT